MNPRTLWALSALWIGLAGAGAALAEEAAPVRFAHAGVSVAVPAGFEAQRPEEGPEVFVLARKDARGVARVCVTLAALPVAAEVSLEQFAQRVGQERSLAVRDLQAQPAEPFDLAGRPAMRQRLGYSFRGEPCQAGRVMVLVDVPGQEAFRMGYVLTAEAGPEHAEQLAPALDAVLATLAFFPPEHPAAGALDAQPIAADDLGFSIRLPASWKIQRGPGYFQAYQVDYRLGGVPYPKLTVSVVRMLDASATVEELAGRAMASARRQWAEHGFEVLAEGPATLGGLDAYRTVSRIQMRDRSVAACQYWAVREGRLYSVSLAGAVLDEQDPAGRVEAMAATLIAGFEFAP